MREGDVHMEGMISLSPIGDEERIEEAAGTLIDTVQLRKKLSADAASNPKKHISVIDRLLGLALISQSEKARATQAKMLRGTARASSACRAALCAARQPPRPERKHSVHIQHSTTCCS